MKTKSILVTVFLLVETLSVLGQGTLLVDQESGPAFNVGGAIIQSSSPIGQSFTPGLNSVGYVALELANDNESGSGEAIISVSLLSGSINGTVLGTTTAVNVPTGAGYQASDFFFPSAISVTPGTTYYFTVNQQSGTPWLVDAYNYEYAGGTEYVNGMAIPNGEDDLWFQEGIVSTPEPSTARLALLGGGLFLAWRRWQMRQC